MMELAYDTVIDWAYTNKTLDLLVNSEKIPNGDFSDDDLDILDKRICSSPVFQCCLIEAVEIFVIDFI